MLIFKGRRKDNNEWIEGPLDMNIEGKYWIEVDGQAIEVNMDDVFLAVDQGVPANKVTILKEVKR